MIGEIFIAIFEKLVLIQNALSNIKHQILRLEILLDSTKIWHVKEHKLYVLVKHFVLNGQALLSL